MRQLNKLRKSEVERARPGIDKKTGEPKTTRLADGGGLVLLAQPDGGRWWRLRYRYQGRQKMLSLGTFPTVDLDAAREKREAALKLLDQGIDPSARRKAERAAQVDSFKGVAEEWLALPKKAGDGTVETMRRRLELHIYPRIGSTPIGEVTAGELLAALRRITVDGRLETAARTRSVCGRIFRYGIATGRCERDVAADLKDTLGAVEKRHFAAITDPKQFGALLRSIDNYSGQPPTRAALKLLPLVFTRPGELRQAEWSEFDLDAAEWVVPAPRMKRRLEHVVPLSTQAVAILTELHKITGRNKLVFPSLRPGRPLSENTLNMALRSLGYDGETHVAHGFRTTASTLLSGMHDDAGHRMFESQVIERQLAHVDSNEIRGIYNRAKFLPQRRAMMQKWADYLDELRTE